MPKPTFNDDTVRLAADRAWEYEKWCKEIPQIEFPYGWKVQIVPPFMMAVVRFQTFTQCQCCEEPKIASCSVYLDCYDKLGIFGQPYWEIYPHEGDTYRCAMAETEELIQALTDSMMQQLEEAHE